MTWNDPEIGIEWPQLVGRYKRSASAVGYRTDDVPFNLSNKYQKWIGLKDRVKF